MKPTSACLSVGQSVCLSTRAVHLEVAVNLSFQGFISAFRRFISRRGKCIELFSDNGTNFRGSFSELKKMFADASKLYRTCAKLIADDDTSWTFIPPRRCSTLVESGISGCREVHQTSPSTSHRAIQTHLRRDDDTFMVLIKVELRRHQNLSGRWATAVSSLLFQTRKGGVYARWRFRQQQANFCALYTS